MAGNELHMLSEEDLKDVTGGYILETITAEGTHYTVYSDSDSEALGQAQSLDDAKSMAKMFKVSPKVITKFENPKTLNL